MAVSLKPSARGGTRRRRLNGGFSDINVTPLVDVMLVLLIVFMVTAPMLSIGVPVDLPKTKAAKMNDQVEPLVVTVDAEGRSYLQETEHNGHELVARLMAITGSNPDAKIYVRGDKNLSYGRIMEVMGEIAAAGFNRVSLIAEMPMASSPVNKEKSVAPSPAKPMTPQPAVKTTPVDSARKPEGGASRQPPVPFLAKPTSAGQNQAPTVPSRQPTSTRQRS